jgi:hypothetical protein
VRFQILTAMSMKVAIFWDVAPRSVVEINHCTDDWGSTSETLVNFYQTIDHNIPEDGHLQKYRHFKNTFCLLSITDWWATVEHKYGRCLLWLTFWSSLALI